jgi:hypothetical protein
MAKPAISFANFAAAVPRARSALLGTLESVRQFNSLRRVLDAEMAEVPILPSRLTQNQSESRAVA